MAGGTDLKWKQIRVNKLSTPTNFYFIQWSTVDHPRQDGKVIIAIEKITIAHTDHLSDSLFKAETLDLVSPEI